MTTMWRYEQNQSRRARAGGLEKVGTALVIVLVVGLLIAMVVAVVQDMSQVAMVLEEAMNG